LLDRGARSDCADLKRGPQLVQWAGGGWHPVHSNRIGFARVRDV
jgi:hypothetical protein